MDSANGSNKKVVVKKSLSHSVDAWNLEFERYYPGIIKVIADGTAASLEKWKIERDFDRPNIAFPSSIDNTKTWNDYFGKLGQFYR